MLEQSQSYTNVEPIRRQGPKLAKLREYAHGVSQVAAEVAASDDPAVITNGVMVLMTQVPPTLAAFIGGAR
jgi:hypothetical protein